MAATEIAMTFLVWLPKIFWDDHVSRDLDFTSSIVKENKKAYQVLMTIDAINELASDADYYSSFDGEDARDNRSVVNSAKSTLAALERQGF
jgi:hypothetical protein